MRKVLVAGSFELLHFGHLSLFKQAKQKGDFLVVVVARDSSVRKDKGREPLVGERERLEVVSSLRMVDEAVLGDERDRFAAVREEKPAVVLLGYDQEVDVEGLKKACREVGAAVVRARPFNEKAFKSSLLAKKVGL